MSDLRNFRATQRRINFLKNEIYNYDKFFRRSDSADADVSHHTKWAIDADDNQHELDELEFLIRLAAENGKPSSVNASRFEMLFVAFVSILSVILSAMNLTDWLR